MWPLLTLALKAQFQVNNFCILFIFQVTPRTRAWHNWREPRRTCGSSRQTCSTTTRWWPRSLAVWASSMLPLLCPNKRWLIPRQVHVHSFEADYSGNIFRAIYSQSAY
jgi:hypothetical protein